MSATLEVSHIAKAFDRKRVIDDVSFKAKPGEFIVLVGPSGCGKSTILRSIAGLEAVDRGQIHIGGNDVTHLAPKDRNIAMVFQDYALYPHKNVYENIAFGLRIRRLKEEEIDRRVRSAADKLGLDSLLERKPSALSGGQRQRVAIGRAIVRQPDVFLFDEPLSNLDAKLRGTMRLTIYQLHKELGTTVVYVTHDQIEAMTLADRIIVLEGGRVRQIGSPLDLYYHPKNRFVARFIGSPPMNMLKGKLMQRGDEMRFVSEHGLDVLMPARFNDRLKKHYEPGKEVYWGLRAENLVLSETAIFEEAVDEAQRKVRLKAKVLVTEILGPSSHLLCDINGHKMQIAVPEPHRPKAGDTLDLAWTSKHLYLFDVATEMSLIEEMDKVE